MWHHMIWGLLIHIHISISAVMLNGKKPYSMISPGCEQLNYAGWINLSLCTHFPQVLVCILFIVQMGVDVQRWKMMRGVKVWRSRQVSVGYISSHAWRLPAVINVCLWVYALPLLLAVNVETLSDPSKLIPQMHAFVYLAAVSPSRGEQ